MKRGILDTNAVVGFLVDRDDLLERSLETFSGLYLPTEVFTETIFVLESEYDIQRDHIFDALCRVLFIEKIEYERPLLLNALLLYNQRNIDIVDCLVVVRAELLGGIPVSLDRHVKKPIKQ